MSDSLEKEVPAYCYTGDGMMIMLPEDVVAVLNLMGYEIFFSRSFCDVEMRSADDDELLSVRGFTDYSNDGYGWKYDLIRWVRAGAPDEWKGGEE